jgi:hypothetical protein
VESEFDSKSSFVENCGPIYFNLSAISFGQAMKVKVDRFDLSKSKKVIFFTCTRSIIWSEQTSNNKLDKC